MVNARARRSPALAVLATALSLPVAMAQAPPERPSTPTFADRVEVSVIELEVSVMNRHGRPIEGLGRGAFTVYEDGRKVELLGFEEVHAVEPGGPPPVNARAEKQLSPPSGETEQRYLAIWVDLAATDPHHRNRALRDLRELVEARSLFGWWAAVVAFDRDIEVLQSFTRDADAVIAALERLEKRTGRPSAGQREWLGLVSELQRMVREMGCAMAKDMMIARIRDYHAERHHDIDGSLRALGEFINSLGGLPFQKDVLVLTEGLSVRPGEEFHALVGDWCGDDHRLQLEGQTLPGLAALDDLASLASQRRVRLHPVDLGGLAGVASHDVAAAGGATVSVTVETLRRTNQREVPAVLAERSGGRALVDTNDFASGLRQLLLEMGHHYRLAYRPAREGDDREHRLRVEVAEPHAIVRHRRTHKDRSGAMRIADRTLATLWYDLEHNPLAVELTLGTPQPLAAGVTKVAARVRIPARNLSLVSQGDLHLGRLELFAASRDTQGRRSVPQRFVVPLRLSRDDLRRGVVGLELELTLREESAAVAFTVFDDLAGTGSYLLRTVEPPPAVAPAPPGSR